MKEGIVTIGFSKPYVALLSEEGGEATYTQGQRLARGVDVSVTANTSDDNPFYADNIEAENDTGAFGKPERTDLSSMMRTRRLRSWASASS